MPPVRPTRRNNPNTRLAVHHLGDLLRLTRNACKTQGFASYLLAMGRAGRRQQLVAAFGKQADSACGPARLNAAYSLHGIGEDFRYLYRAVDSTGSMIAF